MTPVRNLTKSRLLRNQSLCATYGRLAGAVQSAALASLRADGARTPTQAQVAALHRQAKELSAALRRAFGA